MRACKHCMENRTSSSRLPFQENHESDRCNKNKTSLHAYTASRQIGMRRSLAAKVQAPPLVDDRRSDLLEVTIKFKLFRVGLLGLRLVRIDC